MNMSIAQQLDELDELTGPGIALPSERHHPADYTTNLPFQHGMENTYSGREYSGGGLIPRFHASREQEPMPHDELGGFGGEFDEEDWDQRKAEQHSLRQYAPRPMDGTVQFRQDPRLSYLRTQSNIPPDYELPFPHQRFVPQQGLQTNRFTQRAEDARTFALPTHDPGDTRLNNNREPWLGEHKNLIDEALSSPAMRGHPSMGMETDSRIETSPTDVEQKNHRKNRFHSATGKHAKEPVPTQITVQGVALVPTGMLPDRLQSIFPFPLFNAVQSKCFHSVYQTSDNFVLSAPTGSGKTAVMEIAICRLINSLSTGDYKIVYQAPTKSLCSERQKDWEAKFGPLGLDVAELTGDTEASRLKGVQQASIIVTTPEKWDSITRKWKDHSKLMQMVRLFLIDEVHILKEDRGATLEAIVSRMKSIGSDVRFIALSATVPNAQDIATWLGKSAQEPDSPAAREMLGEEFRPVKLQKEVIGYNSSSNDFAFDKMLTSKLPDVIAKGVKQKPLMVFCFTRNACIETARFLAEWWTISDAGGRRWDAPARAIAVNDKELNQTLKSGVAFHHAGMSVEDRSAIETGYLKGDIHVICCTSTLAVGVNLPCHMVIIKGTSAYHGPPVGCREYSDLEVMQMLGRAGRPQFDSKAMAFIMTRSHRKSFYETLITGKELLESCLHRNLIDHLNAEIGLGTIIDLPSAVKWLSGTFLNVRIHLNPAHYKIEGDLPGLTLEERLENICSSNLDLLKQAQLIEDSPRLQCTAFGEAMARCSLKFETMQHILALPKGARTSEILTTIAKAAEFKEIRFRSGEKQVYRELNKTSSIKFPLHVSAEQPMHKVLLIIQAVLGGAEFEPMERNRQEYYSNRNMIFQHGSRIIRCIIDCKIHLQDSTAVRNALELSRSFGSQAWDDSPLHMRQLRGIGPVSVKKLIAANIKSIERLAEIEPHRIEVALSANPPKGTQIQKEARAFPALRVSLRILGDPVKSGDVVMVKLKAELGFMNEKVPETFSSRPVHVSLLVETSDGMLVHFAHTSAKKLGKGQDVLCMASIRSPDRVIRAYVMCDDLASTQRSVSIKHEIPSSLFPPVSVDRSVKGGEDTHRTDIAQKSGRSSSAAYQKTQRVEEDEFGGDSIADEDFKVAEASGFQSIDDFTSDGEKSHERADEVHHFQPVRLPNGRWECKHPCKDKTSCKHTCCREGLDKPPKSAKQKIPKNDESELAPRQTQLTTVMPPKQSPFAKGESKAATPCLSSRVDITDIREVKDLERLHKSTGSAVQVAPTLSLRSFIVPAALSSQTYGKSTSARRIEDDTPTNRSSSMVTSDGFPDHVRTQRTAMTALGDGGTRVEDNGDAVIHVHDVVKYDFSCFDATPATLSDPHEGFINSEEVGQPVPELESTEAQYFGEGASAGVTSDQRTCQEKSAFLFIHSSDFTDAVSSEHASSTGVKRSADDDVQTGPFEKRQKSTEHAEINATDQSPEDQTPRHISQSRSINVGNAETGKAHQDKDTYEWFRDEFGFEQFEWID